MAEFFWIGWEGAVMWARLVKNGFRSILSSSALSPACRVRTGRRAGPEENREKEFELFKAVLIEGRAGISADVAEITGNRPPRRSHA
ncbi:hypothetical protein QCM77_35465 [Bradyrhizobium sp. SSUT18]|uniref:hypothetical protein n=1 Tax=Bradyrhizobium sp. SSUT18 TaxID=3040602 RepID=UPI00244D3828|nr:hypothetical protein [Bradyrhizobium sp. SSUT18]MDH2405168.1 hypothetical protein [Bradyrhizobium sp. SSUT18]